MYICFAFALCTTLRFLAWTFQYFRLCVDFYECMHTAAVVISILPKIKGCIHWANCCIFTSKQSFPSERSPFQLQRGQLHYDLTSFLLRDLEQQTSGQECGFTVWRNSVCFRLWVKSKPLKCHQRMCTLFCTTFLLILPWPQKHLENICAFLAMLLQDNKVKQSVEEPKNYCQQYFSLLLWPCCNKKLLQPIPVFITHSLHWLNLFLRKGPNTNLCHIQDMFLLRKIVHTLVLIKMNPIFSLYWKHVQVDPNQHRQMPRQFP